MKSISNERGFAYYRSRISDHLKRYAGQNFDLPDADSRQFLVANAYFGRYSARGGAIAGTRGYGAIPLADRGAAPRFLRADAFPGVSRLAAPRASVIEMQTNRPRPVCTRRRHLVDLPPHEKAGQSPYGILIGDDFLGRGPDIDGLELLAGIV